MQVENWRNFLEATLLGAVLTSITTHILVSLNMVRRECVAKFFNLCFQESLQSAFLKEKCVQLPHLFFESLKVSSALNLHENFQAW